MAGSPIGDMTPRAGHPREGPWPARRLILGDGRSKLRARRSTGMALREGHILYSTFRGVPSHGHFRLRCIRESARRFTFRGAGVSSLAPRRIRRRKCGVGQYSVVGGGRNKFVALERRYRVPTLVTCHCVRSRLGSRPFQAETNTRPGDVAQRRVLRSTFCVSAAH